MTHFGIELGARQIDLGEGDELMQHGMQRRLAEVLGVAVQPYVQGGHQGSKQHTSLVTTLEYYTINM